jgi:CheW-like domain
MVTMNTASIKYPNLDVNNQSNLDRSSSKKYFGFEICGIKFLLDTDVFCEVIIDPKYSVMPNSPEFFLGLQNLRGHLVPIYKLNKFLEKSDSDVKKILFINRGDSAFGICIDSLPCVLSGDFIASGLDVDLDNDFIDFVVDKAVNIDGICWNLLKPRDLGEYLLGMVK